MPNCFQLISKETGKPVILQDVDHELWIHFEGKEPEGNDHWYANWYNSIGFSLAMGKDWVWCFDNIEEREEVVLYLMDKYDTDAWASR